MKSQSLEVPHFYNFNHTSTQSKPISKLGIVEAGFASPVEEDFADLMRIDEYIIRDKEASFLLRMEGDRLLDEGICDGDLIVFERSDRFNPGDLCVYLTSEGYRIARYIKRYIKNETQYDQSAGEMAEQDGEQSTELIGPVISVIRKYK